ncbi:MAG: pilus assembly protein PilM [Lacunisphaera sp.]|nr:pilus assembly protein PilM [Lacunisphaera sp.]
MPPVFFCPRTAVLDCGASHTALGVFTCRRDRLRLEECAVETFPAPAGQDENWLERTRTACLALRSRILAPGPVVLVLPGHLTLTKLLRVPRVNDARREKVIRFEAEQCLPYALADMICGHVVASDHERELDVLLAAAKLSAVEPLCAAVLAAGFEPQLILPAALATLAAFRLVRPAPAGATLVLNLGARTTTFLLVEPQRFALRALALGGNNLTQQIAVGQDCDAEAAEAIKLSEPSAPLRTDAVETFATRLAQETTRSVLHFRRQSNREPPARIYLTGGGAQLAGLGEALSARLKVPVEPLDTLAALEIANPKTKHAVAGYGTALTDLVGAAATQLLPGQDTLSLLPPELRQSRDRRRRQPWLIAAAVLAVAALLPPVLYFRGIADEARGKTGAIERELAPLRERDSRNRSNLAQLVELRRRVARLQSIHDRRAGWLNLLADLQDRLVRAEDVWLEKLAVTAAENGAPVQLHLAGRMLDRTNPLARVSPEAATCVQALLRDIDSSPYVKVAAEGQRFDGSQPGILKFDFMLVADPARPL